MRSIQLTSLLWLVICRRFEKNCTLRCNVIYFQTIYILSSNFMSVIFSQPVHFTAARIFRSLSPACGRGPHQLLAVGCPDVGGVAARRCGVGKFWQWKRSSSVVTRTSSSRRLTNQRSSVGCRSQRRQPSTSSPTHSLTHWLDVVLSSPEPGLSTVWINGSVVSALGIRTRGPRFESLVAPLFHWVATLGQLFTHIASAVSQLQETAVQKGVFSA